MLGHEPIALLGEKVFLNFSDFWKWQLLHWKKKLSVLLWHTHSHNIFEADISSRVNKVLHCVFMTSFSCSEQKGSLMKWKKQIEK